MSSYQNSGEPDFYRPETAGSNLTSQGFVAATIKCRSRKKTDTTWEQADKHSNGLFSNYLQQIAKSFPVLTTMELKVCVLIKALKPSREISEILFISEHTVENHRVNISNSWRRMASVFNRSISSSHQSQIPFCSVRMIGNPSVTTIVCSCCTLKPPLSPAKVKPSAASTAHEESVVIKVSMATTESLRNLR